MVVLISGLIGTVTITLIRGGDRNVRLDNDYSANGRLDRSHSIRLPDGAARTEMSRFRQRRGCPPIGQTLTAYAEIAG